MANKQILSVVAASVLAASFTFTGCGSSDSDDDQNTSSSAAASSEAPQPVIVRVSDAYVLGGIVKAGDTTADNEVGEGQYEFTQGASGALTLVSGANDTAEPIGEATEADPFAPKMTAPEGSKNINPFTTMIVNGKTLDELKNEYPSLAAYDSVDMDVVAKAKDNPDLLTDTAIAALRLSAGETPASSEAPASSNSATTECVPDFPGDCT
jgi:hypothetical protein